ncbi:MAG TPA: hypothetical protein VEH02_09665 [Pseudolabrys sp.]|nr:hypothetical protein [Pseudolabrys sp.]
MRRAMVAVVLLAMLTTPAFAQGRGQQQKPELPEDIQKRKDIEAVDQQYKATIKRTQKEDNVRIDPWANMRGPNDGKR